MSEEVFFRHIFLLHKRERLCFFIRALWALFQHLAVGNVAQSVADVPVCTKDNVKNIIMLDQDVIKV